MSLGVRVATRRTFSSDECIFKTRQKRKLPGSTPSLAPGGCLFFRRAARRTAVSSRFAERLTLLGLRYVSAFDCSFHLAEAYVFSYTKSSVFSNKKRRSRRLSRVRVALEVRRSAAKFVLQPEVVSLDLSWVERARTLDRLRSYP